MLNFLNTTLVFVDGTGDDFYANENIIKKMRKIVKFYDIKHFTVSSNSSSQSTTVKLTKPLSYREYQAFCIYGVNKEIKTDFALFMQTDGFICNPTKFKNDFFNYDYIGAPWPKNLFKTLSPHNELVGNGGFSLRSKKLLDLCENIPEVIFNEDITICHNYRKQFEVNGCNFAPYEVAKNFSIEIQCSNDHVIEECFGFHGKAHIENATKLLNKHLNYDEMKV